MTDAKKRLEVKAKLKELLCLFREDFLSEDETIEGIFQEIDVLRAAAERVTVGTGARAVAETLEPSAIPEREKIPHADADAAKNGWRLDYNWVSKFCDEIEKTTGYQITMECAEEAVVRTIALLSAEQPTARREREALREIESIVEDELGEHSIGFVSALQKIHGIANATLSIPVARLAAERLTAGTERLYRRVITTDRIYYEEATTTAPVGDVREAREKEITRLATIEECAKIADAAACAAPGITSRTMAQWIAGSIRALQRQEPISRHNSDDVENKEGGA